MGTALMRPSSPIRRKAAHSMRTFTYIGAVVVSVNPYKKLALYCPDVIQAYEKCSMFELPPHMEPTCLAPLFFLSDVFLHIPVHFMTPSFTFFLFCARCRASHSSRDMTDGLSLPSSSSSSSSSSPPPPLPPPHPCVVPASQRSMEALGMSQGEVHAVLQVVAVVLKLGNVEFQPRANIDDTEAVPFSMSMATYSKNALCKALYSRLFTWLVGRINDSIRAKRLGRRKCLGILDIYGFEVLEKNCFEQFVINYCNEKLQQLFIVLTLKQEQEEYVREGLQWEHIDYFNNAIICDLIEKNNHGILAMLDEECLRPGPASDESFLYKLTKVCQESPYFESKGCKNLIGAAADVSLPPQCFRLRHYAGAVTYSVVGFIDKNNDHLYRDLSQAMYNCDHPLMKVLFPEGNPKRTTLKRPTTTATQFKISIGALVKNLQAKTPNYVRCIKPNELKQPMIFEMALVQHQVRYLG
ncbi:hypothetical protein HPB48_002604 [Haemaphysalis longicornis]|uniref:Myosin motor domain-containing protein n=1 Tax=Haemaphysalis longicornis TaxID=44386 RepID=A0A9J6G0T2_HAELO|nr:hypothetical protein HPB48_002604 [Haemaphysalis longicornis]